MRKKSWKATFYPTTKPHTHTLNFCRSSSEKKRFSEDEEKKSK